MKLTILTGDGAVYKDGLAFHNLDLPTIPKNVHALQWDTDTNTGWIEFLNESEFRRPPNEAISSLPYWANDAMGKWQEAYEMLNQPAPDQADVSGAQTL